MKTSIALAALIMIVAACSQKDSSLPESKSSPNLETMPAKVVSLPAATPEQWKTALLSTYDESQVKDAGDGVTNFMAQFKPPRDGLSLLAFGTRDAFRKLRFYHPGMPVHVSTAVKTYVSVADNEKPVLFLQPYYWGRSWLFFDKVAILVDGELALEHTCSDPERDTRGVGVEEKCDFILNRAEIDSLRKINNSSKVSIRLTGKKGYANVGRDGYNPLKDFVKEIQSGIAIYDLINNAVEQKIPPKTEA